MNAKDLKTDSALGGHINDGSTKYAQSGSSHQNNSNKSYQDMGASAMGKVDVQTSRPCAIIGPDRVLPSQTCNDGYMKKTTAEPWPCIDNLYRQTSEYTHKVSEYPPTRNISPRQTFQENMQRIMVSPYSSVKKSDDPNIPIDRNVTLLKDVKLNIPIEAKYCEVPYTVNPACNEQKSVRVADMRVSNVSPGATRSTPHAWPHNNINVRPLRPYGVPELYQYSDYPSCTGSRPVPMVRPQRIVHDESGRIYQEPYYQDANIRFRPYPPTKGRYPHGRYEYVSNYSNTFQPSPPFPPQAYDSQKSMPSHSYPVYPQGPLKFIDRRTGEPIIDGYQRANPPQGNINVNYHNPIIHPPYGPLQPNCVQNNIFSYPSENSPKAVTLNKLPYANNSKIYADYEILQNKKIPITETVYANDVNRIHSMKGEVAYPNYAPVNVHGIPHHAIYRRENITLKNFEYMPHLKNFDNPVNFRNQLLRHPIHFSPNSIAISPSDSNTSNDASQTHSSSQEDCGYVSQSSTTSGRSIDLHINGIPNEHRLYRSSDRYGFQPRNIQTQNPNNKNLKVKKDINVRQFLQMWNEGDDELGEHNKDDNIVKVSNNLSSMPSQYEGANKQEQLYVLGLVNVPSEELDKYNHIQKISKLPENIKGYNNIELLNQFEEVIESSNMRGLSKTQRVPIAKQIVKTIPRPVSPLDVEAKISQSVIHKEVGCNFEIKPCSPKMLNVEIAAPVENILDERIIEKVSNPIIAQSIKVPKTDKINNEGKNFSNTGSVVLNNNCGKNVSEVGTAPSCNMDSLKYPNDNSLDLEYNSSVCLASLPRLDNEIELNFPEINQQFINANKIESLTPIAFKESSNLDSGHLDSNIKYEKAGQMAEFSKCSPSRESDKEFTKLSKYRKLKKTETDQKDIQNKSIVLDPTIKTQFRTDSVIIKNPENVKLLEVNLSPSNARNTDSNTIMISSMEISQNNKSTSDVIKDDVSFNAKSPSIYNSKENSSEAENALDFSLNKSDSELRNNCSKASIANESFLNFIEENLNISESYEITKSATDSNNHQFGEDDNDKVRATVDSTKNNSIISSSNDEQLCEKNKTEDLYSNHDLAGENNKKINEIIQLELNYSTNNELISTDIEMTGNNSLPIILQNLNESSLNNVENEIPETRQQVEDKSKDATELANCDHENKIHNENYPTRGNNLEAGNIDDVENDSDKMTNETCEIFHKEPDLNSLNIPNNASNFDCKDVESSLESIIDNNVHTFEKEVDIDCEYKTLEEENILPEFKTDIYKKATEKKFNKRLYSSIIRNLMVSIDESPKEKTTSYEITSVVFQNDDTMKINNCINQSTCLEEDCAVKLECKTLDTEISNVCQDSLETYEIGSTDKLVTEQFNIEMSETLSHNNTMEIVNEESCPYTNNIYAVEDSGKSCSNSKNETTDIEKNTDNNLCYGCPEEMETPNDKCSNSTVEDNDMLLSDQKGSSEIAEKQLDYLSIKEVPIIQEPVHSKSSFRLKRSLSDSALNVYANENHNDSSPYYNIPKKRKKINPCELMEPNIIAQNICNIIQTNRRNSISTLYNEENVSFCILIDNSCDLIDENTYAQKISLAEITEGEFEDEFKDKCIMSTETVVFKEDLSNKRTCTIKEDYDTNAKNEVEFAQTAPENGFTYENPLSERNEDKTYDETWIEDVACIETVFSDDITEDIVLDPPSTPKDNHKVECDCESDVHNESLIYNDIDHMNKLKYIYGSEMCNDDVDLVETLYRTPQMDLRKTLVRRESQYSDDSTRYYDNDSLEKILSESNYKEEITSDSESSKIRTNIVCTDTIYAKNKQDDKENLKYELPLQNSFDFIPGYPVSNCYDKQQKSLDKNTEPTQYDVVHSCVSTSPYKNTCESPRYSNSSSPEVSSTTSEEKSCGILLKITNCNGSISSQLNDLTTKTLDKSIIESPEKKELINFNCNPARSRPLITKAAQKYIPPLKETIPDLKIKLPLPKHSLNKLKILKISKDKPRLDKPVSKTNSSPQKHYPKKSKPKFEDVLKSIDEIHIKMHKEKNKKQKHSIPKVVIKKNENGAHYTSTSDDIEAYNPDLTGRKWQPWVFIEKNYFIDKMALNKKAKAVFNYRKNTYVLAEKFRKYKSVNNANFVISQPKMEDISSGKLKYTIRLKHNY